jgi:hypothetical protein
MTGVRGTCAGIVIPPLKLVWAGLMAACSLSQRSSWSNVEASRRARARSAGVFDVSIQGTDAHGSPAAAAVPAASSADAAVPSAASGDSVAATQTLLVR